MANQTLENIEERLTELEARVARLQSEKQTNPPRSGSWLDKHFGAFKDNPYYEAAMELGVAYRNSQPTAADKSADQNKEDANAISSGY